MFGKKEAKKDESKIGKQPLEPKSPSVLHPVDHGKHDKWREKEKAQADKMAKKALQEEDPSVLPLAVRQLEYCPAPTRRHTQFLLSGYLAVKTSGGWTRKWQTRYVVLTPSALYVYKRPPTHHEDTFGPGPELTLDQVNSVTSAPATLEKDLTNADTITSQRLAKIMSTADTTDDGSHELFGAIRDSMPIAQSTVIMEVSTLPNTFCLTFPDTPRLLLRAANHEQFKLWQHTIQTAILLQTYPPHMIATQIARKSVEDSKDLLHLVPHIEELLPVFADRGSVVSQIALHHTNSSLYTDATIINKDPTNIPTEVSSISEPQATIAPKLNPTNIVNSTTMNSQIVSQQTVNLNTQPSQGAIITNLTPWGQKVNIVLNQLPTTTTIPANSASNVILEQTVKEQSITLQIADGGYITIPLEQLYEQYKNHLSRQQELKKYSAGPKSDNNTAPTNNNNDNNNGVGQDDNNNNTARQQFSENFADSLFTVSNGLYNSDVHLGFRFTTYPTARKDPQANKGKKLNPKQLAQLRQQQEQAMEQLKQGALPSVNGMAGLLSLAVTCYLAYNLHHSFPTSTTQEVATLWIAYLVLVTFTLRMANITLPFARRRESLEIDRDAITKIVNLSGYQQAQLPAASGSDDKNKKSTTTSTTTTSNIDQQIPVLEIVPIRIVDRHTITGAVLLGGSKFDHESFPPLPIRTSATPQISLLKAIHSNTSALGSKATTAPQMGLMNLDDDDDAMNGGDQSSSDIDDSDDDAVFETNPHLGKVYVEQWGKWSQSDYRNLVLRGPDYLTNKKKPKIPALPHRFQACMTVILAMKESQTHCARWMGSYFRKQRQKAADLGKADWWKPGTPLKYLIVNMLVPGTPNYNFCMYYRNPHIYPSPYPDHIQQGIQQEYHPTSPDKPTVWYPDQQPGKPDPFASLLHDFITKDDAYRKAHFKYIPNVAEGAWIVKRTVGQTPVIMGNKLTQSYFLDPHGQYVEIDIDVGSSSMAGSILSMVKGYAKTLEIDLSWLMEPHREEELPEKLWAGTRIYNVDLNNVEETEVVHGPADD